VAKGQGQSHSAGAKNRTGKGGKKSWKRGCRRHYATIDGLVISYKGLGGYLNLRGRTSGKKKDQISGRSSQGKKGKINQQEVLGIHNRVTRFSKKRKINRKKENLPRGLPGKRCGGIAGGGVFRRVFQRMERAVIP